MSFSLTSSFSSEFSLLNANLTDNRTLILIGAFALLALVLIVQLFRNREQVSSFISSIINPEPRMAQLNKVVCHHCNRGNGIINPRYLTIDGDPHVRGKCNHCGTKITVKLR